MSDNEEESDPYDQKIKIMILGETLVGKTALITRYTKNSFAGTYLTTVGIDFQYKSLNINDKKIKVEIWDTAGQERFRNIAKNYFHSSDGFLLLYDITCRDSFEKISFWHEQIKINSPQNTKWMLIGNKCDLEEKREVTKEQGENKARFLEVAFMETSALSGENLDKAFEMMMNEIYKKCHEEMLAEGDVDIIEGGQDINLAKKMNLKRKNVVFKLILFVNKLNLFIVYLIN